MVFYFTGTGNSLQAATDIGDNIGDYIVDMGQAIKSKNMSYRRRSGEKIGFVIPVYYSGIPTVVAKFIEEVNITSDDDAYIYAVFTCGAWAAGADVMFKRLMSRADFHVDYCAKVKMPDNYVMLYNPSGDDEAQDTLRSAKSEILEICDDIRDEKKGGFKSGVTGKLICGVMQPMYNAFRATRRFSVNGDCIGCGECADNCPEAAIELRDKMPVWVQPKCAHCAACISRCPVRAIDYGRATKKRNRYLNPMLK